MVLLVIAAAEGEALRGGLGELGPREDVRPDLSSSSDRRR